MTAILPSTPHHIGLVCTDIDRTRSYVHSTFAVDDDSGIVFDDQQDAHLCMLQLEDGTRLELVSGPGVEALIQRGMTYYHLCYEVSDLAETLATLTASGARVIRKPRPAVLFNGRLVGFVLTPLGIVELLEAP